MDTRTSVSFSEGHFLFLTDPVLYQPLCARKQYPLLLERIFEWVTCRDSSIREKMGFWVCRTLGWFTPSPQQQKPQNSLEVYLPHLIREDISSICGPWGAVREPWALRKTDSPAQAWMADINRHRTLHTALKAFTNRIMAGFTLNRQPHTNTMCKDKYTILHVTTGVCAPAQI